MRAFDLIIVLKKTKIRPLNFNSQHCQFPEREQILIITKRIHNYTNINHTESYNNIQNVSFHQWLTSCCTDPVMILYYAVPGLLGCLSSACTWHQKQFSSNRASRQHQPKHLLQKDGKYKTLLNNCVFKVSFDNLWYLLTQGSRSFIFKEAAFFSNVDSKKESRWKKKCMT